MYNNDGDNAAEDITSIKGITTYTDDNGMIKTAELDNSKVYKVKENKHYTCLNLPCLLYVKAVLLNIVIPYIHRSGKFLYLEIPVGHT